MHIDPPALGPRVPGERTRARLQQFYRSSHDYAHQQSQHDAAYFRKFADVVIHALPETTVDVLEVGAGSGEAMRPLIEQRASVRVTALDLSLLSLSNVRERNPRRVAPLLGDALALPVRDRSFDAIVCFEVIEHLPDVAAAVEEMLRVLKRPGHLIFGLPNHASLWTPLEDILLGRTRLAFGVDGRRGALQWLAKNLRVAIAKRTATSDTFLYREPVLDGVTGGDGDAVYYCCPLDLTRHLRRRGARLVETSAHRRFGRLGWLLPSEFQGSSVLAWTLD